MERVRPALQAALEHALRLPPLGLVADLVALLDRQSRLLVGADVPGLTLRRYDDRVVGPLLTAPLRDGVQDAWMGLDASWRGVAAAVLSERLAEALEPDGPWWKPAAVRKLLDMSDHAALELGLAALGASMEVREELAQRIDGVANRGPALFTGADVHLFMHLTALVTRGQRVAVRQVLEAAEGLSRELPHKVRSRARPGPLATNLQDEDLYPTGGFSSLSRRGSFENLVPSELVYLEDGGGPDLFDLRYVEHELLFYHRDESVHLRRRRRIHVVLGSDLANARVKDPDLPYQRGVLLMGLLTAVLTRVVAWLGDHELVIVLHPVAGALDEDRELLELVLGDLQRAGVLEFKPLTGLWAVTESVLVSAQHADVDVVWISVDEPDLPELPVEVFRLPVVSQSWGTWSTLARDLALFLG